MSRVESINRKMLKGVIAEVVDADETVELVDVGSPMSAAEGAEFTKKVIKDVYKKAALATPAIAAGAQRAGKRAAMGGYAEKLSEVERYAVIVTDRMIRVIPVATKSKAFGVQYVLRDDLDSRTYRRDTASIDLGDAVETSIYGQKSLTIEVAMSGPDSESVLLTLGNVEGWRSLAGA